MRVVMCVMTSLLNLVISIIHIYEQLVQFYVYKSYIVQPKITYIRLVCHMTIHTIGVGSQDSEYPP